MFFGVLTIVNKQKDVPIYFGKVRVPSCKAFSKDLRGHPSLLVSTICDRLIIHINILETTWPKTLAYDKEFTFISSCQIWNSKEL